MKIINYSLFTFILIFFLVSFFYKPKENRFEKKIETPYEFPEVNLKNNEVLDCDTFPVLITS